MADEQTEKPAPNPIDDQLATNLIRDKIARVYSNEPAADQESTEAKAVVHRSKHQQFMYELSTSGKDLATVQTEWHEYYQSLPADEKHQVWQEFYESQPLIAHKNAASPALEAQQLAEHKHGAQSVVVGKAREPKLRVKDSRSAKDIQAAIRHNVSGGGKLKTKHHIQSLLFGLGMGAIVIIIFLFGLFNEVVLAPFIQPSRTATATPLIISDSTVAATATPEVIIPKINVEIPVVYSETSTNEATIENDLQSGVVHYPTTSLPGEVGNAAFFGHSSNNIFNKGKYKFAFVLLHTLVPGDTFYLTYNGKVYAYKVISKTVVDPSDVSVLGPVEGQVATATLITCDPPGTSLKRLIIVGQQVSPDPANNTASAASDTSVVQPATLPGNGPTLWARLVSSTGGKLIIFAIIGFGLLILLATVVRLKD